jgi:hypothetical protein
MLVKQSECPFKYTVTTSSHAVVSNRMYSAVVESTKEWTQFPLPIATVYRPWIVGRVREQGLALSILSLNLLQQLMSVLTFKHSCRRNVLNLIIFAFCLTCFRLIYRYFLGFTL